MVFLTSLQIENFKWYKDSWIINFSIPSQENNKIGLTIIVWPNNSWKTTILDSILKLKNNSRIEDSQIYNNELDVIIKFTTSNWITNILKNIDKWSMLNLEWDLSINNFSLVSSRRQWNHKFSIWNMEMSSYETNSLSSVENKYQIDSYFWQLLSSINRDTEKKKSLTNFLKKLIPWFYSWTIKTREQDYIEYQTKNWISHEASLLWDWVISLFKIGVHIVYDTNTILYLDEPELSLHPETQKLLSKEIIKLSKTRQIIINTHSPYFVNLEEVKKWLEIIRTNKVNWEYCSIFKINETVLNNAINSLTNNNWQKPQAFDIVWKEIFFWNNIIFVEWQEDVWLIDNYLRENNIETSFSLFWYWSWWAWNIKKLLELAKNLWINAWAIYDNDKVTDLNNSITLFPEFKILKIETDDIRDKEDKDLNLLKIWIFTKNWIIKEEYKSNFDNLIEELNKFFINKN